ncbi:MAG: rhodanese-like domain-containing protein [Hyphomonadaceae bacterium]|jgi:rhodanese-related sulfurtransferase|nr:rhodanese-like domain-containing protein [Hyphomonadaceae bacterium]
MFGFGKSVTHKEIAPEELAAMLKDRSAIVVDVREPNELATGHIAGAINLPLSTFSPDQLPPNLEKTIVLQCAGGKRSGMALDRCAAANAAVDTHLAGAIGAWKAAGLPVVA